MTYVFTLFTINPAISLGDKWGQNLQRPCGDRMETAQSSCTEQTSAQKSHNAHVMSLQKSHRVSALTVRSSCNYVHPCIKHIKLLHYCCVVDLDGV